MKVAVDQDRIEFQVAGGGQRSLCVEGQGTLALRLAVGGASPAKGCMENMPGRETADAGSPGQEPKASVLEGGEEGCAVRGRRGPRRGCVPGEAVQATTRSLGCFEVK